MMRRFDYGIRVKCCKTNMAKLLRDPRRGLLSLHSIYISHLEGSATCVNNQHHRCEGRSWSGGSYRWVRDVRPIHTSQHQSWLLQGKWILRTKARSYAVLSDLLERDTTAPPFDLPLYRTACALHGTKIGHGCGTIRTSAKAIVYSVCWMKWRYLSQTARQFVGPTAPILVRNPAEWCLPTHLSSGKTRRIISEQDVKPLPGLISVSLISNTLVNVTAQLRLPGRRRLKSPE